jgi:hypothetical protein
VRANTEASAGAGFLSQLPRPELPPGSSGLLGVSCLLKTECSSVCCGQLELHVQFHFLRTEEAVARLAFLNLFQDIHFCVFSSTLCCDYSANACNFVFAGDPKVCNIYDCCHRTAATAGHGCSVSSFPYMQAELAGHCPLNRSEIGACAVSSVGAGYTDAARRKFGSKCAIRVGGHGPGHVHVTARQGDAIRCVFNFSSCACDRRAGCECRPTLCKRGCRGSRRPGEAGKGGDCHAGQHELSVHLRHSLSGSGCEPGIVEGPASRSKASCQEAKSAACEFAMYLLPLPREHA